MNMFVGAAVAGAAALPCEPVAAKAAPAGEMLRDLSKPILAELIDNLRVTKGAAEAACTMLSDTEEKYRDADGNLACVVTPKLYGGMTKGVRLIVGEEPKLVSPPHEWFFQDREQVEKEGSPEELAEWDRQAKANARAYPKELRKAERQQLRALDAWTAAERALTKYKPASAGEAVELLTLAGKPQERGALYLDIDEYGMHRLVANCAAALREALAN
jgi:hypothetical protein